MDVKVGQVWLTEQDLEIEVIEEIKPGSFKVRWPYGTETNATAKSFKWWSLINNTKESQPSDLEIVQKALNLTGRVVADTPEDLLTWAKQTIGVE